MAAPTAVRTDAVRRWLSTEARRLAEEHVAIVVHEERVRHLVGLLLASEVSSEEVDRLLPDDLPVKFRRSLPSGVHQGRHPAGDAKKPNVPDAAEMPRSDLQRRLLLVLSQAAEQDIRQLSRAEIAVRINAVDDKETHADSTRKALYRLVESGRLTRTTDGRYQLNQAAQTAHPTNDIR